MRTRDILAANLAALMGERTELGTLKKITEASNGRLSNGKLGRVRTASHATDVDTIGELAAVFGLQPWQLLVKDLNPKALPQIAGVELLETIKGLLAQTGDAVGAGVTSTHQLNAPASAKTPLGRLPGDLTDRTGLRRGSSSASSKDRPSQKGRGSRRA